MTIDLTEVIVTMMGGCFSVASILIPLIIQKRMKDQQAAAALGAAVSNALGAIQRAAQGQVVQAAPSMSLEGVSPALAAGVRYVLDHAGPEAQRFGITPEMIADKISARIGLAEIASNTATASSPGETLHPLAAAAPALARS